MKKPIHEIQNQLVNIIGNVSMISVNQEDNLDKQCKSNAIELLKQVIKDIDIYKNAIFARMDKKEIDKIVRTANEYSESKNGNTEHKILLLI